MKKLLKIIKYIHHFTNHEVNPEDEARDALNYILLRNDTEHSIRIFECLEEQFKVEMLRRKSEAEKICRAVNNKYVPQSVKPRYYDPNFDKSLNELIVSFEA